MAGMNPDYDQLLRLLKSRRSIRKYRPEPIPFSVVEQLIEAVRWAPSAGNRQNFRFLLVTMPAQRKAMAEAVNAVLDDLRANLRKKLRKVSEHYLANFTHFAEAPLILAPIHRSAPSLLVQDHAAAQPVAGEEALCSVSAAITQLLLAAQTLGLGACWMTGPLVARPQLEELLKVPAGWTLSALIPLGYPAESPPVPKRRERKHLILPQRSKDSTSPSPPEPSK